VTNHHKAHGAGNDPAAAGKTPEAAATPGDGAEPLRPIPAPEPELLRLKAERDQLEDQLKRTLADLQNIRRRQQKEMDDSRRRTLEGIAQELLPVLDNFRTALHMWDQQTDNGDTQALVEGVRLVRSLLAGALERHGLQEIQAENRPFDPSQHEAVAIEPRTDMPPGQVIKVLQAGYVLGDHVIRHAKVLVSAAASAGSRGPGDAGPTAGGPEPA